MQGIPLRVFVVAMLVMLPLVAGGVGCTGRSVTPAKGAGPSTQDSGASERDLRSAASEQDGTAGGTGGPAQACSPAGVWNESWSGKAAADGATLSGRSVIRITEEGGSWVGRGADASNPMEAFEGPVTMTGDELVFEYRGRGYKGTHTCSFAGCSKMSCSFSTTNIDGTPNMTGTATWSRR